MANEFNISLANLEDLVMSMPMCAHIKDATTGKFIITNTRNLALFGLTKSGDLIGKTIDDLDVFMRPVFSNSFAKDITNIDQYVKTNNKFTQIDNVLLVAKNGLIHIQDIMKLPLLNNHNQVIAIFTYIYDKTHEVDLGILFKTYQEIYKKKHEVSKYFCQYLGIDRVFSELPSCAELAFLLYAKDSTAHNYLAKKMCRSIKTIETHITHINNKLKIGNFLDIVRAIRSFTAPKLKSIGG